jgi:hypothetical protein
MNAADGLASVRPRDDGSAPLGGAPSSQRESPVARGLGVVAGQTDQPSPWNHWR